MNRQSKTGRCAYLILSYISLFNKLSKGFFYTLSDHYQNGAMKMILKEFMEKYLNYILDVYLIIMYISPPFVVKLEYIEKGDPKHSCDFLIRKDNTLMVIN